MIRKTKIFKIIIFVVIFLCIPILSNETKPSYAGVEYVTPQILIILDNSQSMDGNLSGAIMTGSGTIATNKSSSPVYYKVPSGFTAPVTNSTSGFTYYTSTVKGYDVDNSASRLNVAKEALMASYIKWSGYAQFGLMDYKVKQTPSLYTTWVYYMSGAKGFKFGSLSAAPSGLQTVSNPCYNSTTTSCNHIKKFLGTASETDPYLYIQNTSDESSINDVFYASGWPSNFVSYQGPHPASPYPPNYSLSDYNNGSILETYYDGTDGTGGLSTGPTNAGYVPYSPQVWYSERGFGYYNIATNSGNKVIPIAVSSLSQQSLFASALAPETNNSHSSEIKADAVNAPMAGTLASALTYLTGNSLPTTTCPAKKYVIFVTDGLPTYDRQNRNWPPIGSAAATGYGVTATFNPDGSIATTNDKALSETIAEIIKLKIQGIDTYVIGVGAGVNPAINTQAAAVLKAMAVAGGTNNYFPAITPTAVADDFSIIIQTIVTSGSHTAPVVHETSSNNNNVYYSNFIALNQPLWGEGNIFLFKLNSQGQLTGPNGPAVNANGQIITSDSYWNSGKGAGGALQTESPSSRYIITSTLDPTTGSNNIVPFNTSNTANLESLLGLTSTNYTSVCPSASSESACANDIISFVLNPDSATDNWKLGAIFHSDPVLVGSPPYLYSNASYQAFKTLYNERNQILVAGANDGMLHGFDAGAWDTGTSSYTDGTGSEVFGYIPSNFFDIASNSSYQCPSDTSLTLPKITCWYELSLAPATTDFGSYYTDFEFVDSTPYVSDVFFNNIFNGTTNTIDAPNYPISTTGTPASSWHTVLVGGERNGGTSYYAIGLTNPVNLKNGYPKPLWNFSDASAQTDPMGNTWSKPLITFVCLPNPNYVKVAGGTGVCGNIPSPASPLAAPQYIKTYTAFMGGGYSSNNSAGQALYSLYIEPNPVNTGTTNAPKYVDEQELWKFGSANDTNMQYSVASAISPVLNPNAGLQGFYVGDLGGQMWAFNIPYGKSPYTAGSSKSNWTGCRIFDSNAPAPSLNIFFPPAISYDTTGNLWLFFGTGNRENLTVVNTTRDNELIGLNTSGTQGIGKCALTGPYTESDLINATGTSGIGSIKSGEGWYVKLDPGEKVVGLPSVYDRIVYFATYTPSSTTNSCGYGTAKLYAVYYLDGGGTITQTNGTVTISNTASSSSGASQSMSIGSGVPSAPVISNGNLIITTSTGAVLVQKIPSLPSKLTPTSWFQLP